MALTSFGEVLGALEREAKRATDLHAAAVAVAQLNDAVADKQRELTALTQKADGAKAALDQLTQRVDAAKTRAAEAERKADERTAAALAETQRQADMSRAEASAQAKAIQQSIDADLTRARAELAGTTRAAEEMRRAAAAVKASTDAELAALLAQRDRIKAEVAALRQRLLSTE